MSNPLFQAMNGGGNNMFHMLGQLRQNPLGLLRRAGYNVPGNVSDPRQIVQYLVSTGQVNQSQLDYAQRMAGLVK